MIAVAYKAHISFRQTRINEPERHRLLMNQRNQATNTTTTRAPSLNTRTMNSLNKRERYRNEQVYQNIEPDCDQNGQTKLKNNALTHTQGPRSSRKAAPSAVWN